jgi:DNA polymerase-3 subunit alpha
MESLNDVAAVTSLLRPGPKDMGMDMEYAERKHGKEYEMPQFLKDLMKETYGVLTYQEQAMAISKVLSGFTGPEANKLRKACGKKIPELMAQMKDKFIKGAQPRIDAKEITAEEVEQMWNLVESFSGYAFNKCVTLDTVVETPIGMKFIGEVIVGDKVKTPSGEFVEVEDVIESGSKEVWEFTTEMGKSIRCTLDHKFLCDDGKVRTIGVIVSKKLLVMCDE